MSFSIWYGTYHTGLCIPRLAVGLYNYITITKAKSSPSQLDLPEAQERAVAERRKQEEYKAKVIVVQSKHWRYPWLVILLFPTTRIAISQV